MSVGAITRSTLLYHFYLSCSISGASHTRPMSINRSLQGISRNINLNTKKKGPSLSLRRNLFTGVDNPHNPHSMTMLSRLSILCPENVLRLKCRLAMRQNSSVMIVFLRIHALFPQSPLKTSNRIWATIYLSLSTALLSTH